MIKYYWVMASSISCEFVSIQYILAVLQLFRDHSSNFVTLSLENAIIVDTKKCHNHWTNATFMGKKKIWFRGISIWNRLNKPPPPYKTQIARGSSCLPTSTRKTPCLGRSWTILLACLKYNQLYKLLITWPTKQKFHEQLLTIPLTPSLYNAEVC